MHFRPGRRHKAMERLTLDVFPLCFRSLAASTAMRKPASSADRRHRAWSRCASGGYDLASAQEKVEDNKTQELKQVIPCRVRGRGGLALSPVMVGAEIPADIALRDLKPVPESLTARFTELRGTSYLAEESNVLIVGSNNVVIGVLSAQ